MSKKAKVTKRKVAKKAKVTKRKVAKKAVKTVAVKAETEAAQVAETPHEQGVEIPVKRNVFVRIILAIIREIANAICAVFTAIGDGLSAIGRWLVELVKAIIKRSLYLLWSLLGGLSTVLVVVACGLFCEKRDEVGWFCEVYYFIHEIIRGIATANCEESRQSYCAEAKEAASFAFFLFLPTKLTASLKRIAKLIAAALVVGLRRQRILRHKRVSRVGNLYLIK